MSKPRVQVTHDTNPATPECGVSYITCRKCLDELPLGVSPKEWARQQTSLTEDGLQVWCNRHNINITTMHLGVSPERVM